MSVEKGLFELLQRSERITPATEPAHIESTVTVALEHLLAPAALALYVALSDGALHLVECRGWRREEMENLGAGGDLALPVVRVFELVPSDQRSAVLVLGWKKEPDEAALELARAFLALVVAAMARSGDTAALGDRSADVGPSLQFARLAGALAHEFKNPLASIGGVLEVLQDRATSPPGDREVLDKVLGRLADLNALVDDLVGFARQSMPTKTQVRLDLLVEAAVVAFEARSRGRVAVRVHTQPVEAPIDGGMLERALKNLLDNVGEAMEGRGAMTLDVSRRHNFAEIQLDAQGARLPAADQLFDLFPATTARGGGLGLAIARQVIDVHGGSIRVEHPPVGGARFVVRLPASGTGP